MESQDGNLHYCFQRLNQLEAENKALQEEIIRLRSAHQSAIESLERHLAIEEKYRESQQQFHVYYLISSNQLGSKET